MLAFSDLITGAQFRSDLQGTTRVLQAEWITLVNEAIESVWSQAASARPDFQVKQQDFAVASGVSASFAVPVDFFGEIDVVASPDTVNEYSLGPFAWQNRRSPGGWLAPFMLGSTASGASRARLQGSTIYLEPSMRAAGTYRLWYCPKPKTCKFTVRLATAAALSGALAYTTLGTGVGKTLTGQFPVAITVDGITPSVGDRILVWQQTGGQAADNGIYTVTVVGNAGAQYVLTRATDYDQATADGVYAGNVVTATAGTVNTNAFFELTAFGTNGLGAVDVDGMTWGLAAVDAVLETSGAGELIKVIAGATAVERDNRESAPLRAREQVLRGEMSVYWKQTRTSNVPQKMVDTDMLGPRAFPWLGGS